LPRPTTHKRESNRTSNRVKPLPFYVVTSVKYNSFTESKLYVSALIPCRRGQNGYFSPLVNNFNISKPPQKVGYLTIYPVWETIIYTHVKHMLFSTYVDLYKFFYPQVIGVCLRSLSQIKVLLRRRELWSCKRGKIFTHTNILLYYF
jgi:hypothetical protein